MIWKALLVMSLGVLMTCLVLWPWSVARPISWDLSRPGEPVSSVQEFWQPVANRSHHGDQRWAYVLFADGKATVSYSDYDLAPFGLLSAQGTAIERLGLRLRRHAETPWYATHLGKDGLSFADELEFDEAYLEKLRSFREGSAQFLARQLEGDSFLLRFSSTPYKQVIVGFPIWAPAAICAACPAAAFIRGPVRRHRRRKRGLCARCGYNLTGNVSGRCPECGTLV